MFLERFGILIPYDAFFGMYLLHLVIGRVSGYEYERIDDAVF